MSIEEIQLAAVVLLVIDSLVTSYRYHSLKKRLEVLEGKK